MTVERGTGGTTGGTTYDNYDQDNVAIAGGAINNTTIGATTPSTGSFTTLTANATTTTTLDATTANFTTVTDLGSVTTADINGGTADSVVIGGSSAAAGTFTTLNATGGGALTGTWTDLGSVTTVDINGGTWDGGTIGGSAATTIGANATISSTDTLPAGTVVQVVNVQDGAVATGTTTIPVDDTIPQNTEGDQYMTLSITPKYNNSKLKIDVVLVGSYSVATANRVIALFQDSTASALAAITDLQSTATGMNAVKFTHWMTSGTTSTTTFKVRAGSDLPGTFTFNGSSGARYLGGAMASSITITEIKQ